MQSLHDNNDRTIFVVIESGLDRVSVSVVDMLAFAVRFGIGQLQRVVNDYDIPAATGLSTHLTKFRTDVRPEWLRFQTRHSAQSECL